MRAQLSLFTPYARGSATSQAAAVAIEPVAMSLVERVYRYLRARGDLGATDEQMQIALGLGGSTQRPRRVTLVEQGRVRDSGRTRATLSGRAAVVWVVA